jgi:DNA (cytosine-5)-methyltransferase 1
LKGGTINILKNKIQLTLGSLFDGIGGFPYAGSFFGIKPLWASEIMPQAISVTQRLFPDMEHVGDITMLDGAKLPPVDIITFGSPCQDLSVAGKRAGLGGERSGLFTEAIRIIDEMRRATNGKYPRYALWENVPGALSSGNPRGSDFQAVLEAFAKTEVPMPVSNKWANAGMVRGGDVDLAWCVYNAQYFGVPQRRRRIFLVCDFRSRSAAEILFVPKSLQGVFSTNFLRKISARRIRAQGQSTAVDAERGVGGAGLNKVRTEYCLHRAHYGRALTFFTLKGGL